MIDTHCHILPGIDDGPDDMAESIAMCEIAAQDGVQAVIATPHMLDGAYEAQPDAVRTATVVLQTECDSRGIPLRIYPGGEVFIHEDLVERVASGQAMTLCDGGKYLLVELPSQLLGPWIKDFVFQLRLAGLTPILSHVERNGTVKQDPNFLLPVVEAGALVQITGHSLFGRFGGGARRCAEVLIEHGFAHLVVSDSHSKSGRPPTLRKPVERIAEFAGREVAEQMCDLWPRCIIEGQSIDAPYPTRVDKGVRSWFGSLFGSG